MHVRILICIRNNLHKTVNNLFLLDVRLNLQNTYSSYQKMMVAYVYAFVFHAK